ncbi:MAG TPA: peptidylprolyl isomerase [Bdellovibrionales bacterium]|nr:peptidylprolyl isomerase [Bdellovibrionales bacterium]
MARWALSLLLVCAVGHAADKKTKGKDMIAVMETSLGTMKFKLLPEVAPKTVESFVGLAEGTVEWKNPKTGKTEKAKLYDGTKFHRVMKGFMAQGGDPLGNGTGGPSGKLWPIKNEVDKKVSHNKAGILAMANSGPDTNGSQFYITFAPATFLDGSYTIFGQVVDGEDGAKSLETLRKFEAIETTGSPEKSKPVDPPILKSVKIERK